MSDADDRARADTKKTLKVGGYVALGLLFVIVAVKWLMAHAGQLDEARSRQCANARDPAFTPLDDPHRRTLEERDWAACVQCCGDEVAERSGTRCSCYAQDK